MFTGTIGIIGGTGLYQLEGLENIREVEIDTPFGKPSDNYIIAQLNGMAVVFLSRHGRGHRLMPSELNYRANIYGMKKLGVERIIAISAVGSMREDIKPSDIVIVDQFFDRTRGRKSTFFGDGIVAHVGFADPICPDLAQLVYQAATDVGATVHQGGTYICMEGPQFSTRAESNIYRRWGVDVIGMTNLQEAKLAREAEICFCTVAMATDYDCWHTDHDDVTVEAVIELLNKNVDIAKKILITAIPRLTEERKCSCPNALKDAILTAPDMIPEKIKTGLKPLIGKYLL